MSVTRLLAGRPVQPIGLGCMNLSWAYGTPPAEEDKVRLLNHAIDLGYNHLDTANIYGKGANEELLGRALKGRRHEFLLASKTGIMVDGPARGIDCSPAAMRQSIEDSLARLQTDHIDLFYMHRFDPKLPIADMVGTLAEAITAGKIGAYGVSEWSAAHIREAHGVHPMAAVQTEYSLWTRNVELGVKDACADLGIALVAFSPLGRGAFGGELTDPWTLPQGDLRHTMPRFSAENWPANLRLIRNLAALAQEAGITPAQLALRWVLQQGEHVHAIPGTTSIAHLEQNIAAASVAVTDEIVTEAGVLISQMTVRGHRYNDTVRATIDTEEFGADQAPG